MFLIKFIKNLFRNDVGVLYKRKCVNRGPNEDAQHYWVRLKIPFSDEPEWHRFTFEELQRARMNAVNNIQDRPDAR